MNESVAPPAPPPPHQQISIVRLHGEACIDCGAVHGRLYPAGSVTTMAPDGGHLEWTVVVCAWHRRGTGVRDMTAPSDALPTTVNVDAAPTPGTGADR